MVKTLFDFDDNDDQKRKKREEEERKKRKLKRGSRLPEGSCFHFGRVPEAKNPTDIQNLLREEYRGPVLVTLNRFVVRELLKNNERNRTCSAASVEGLLKSYIKTGYEPIGMMALYSDGTLADGQHRLKAIQRYYDSGNAFSPIPVQPFYFGVDDSRGLDIDNGRPRSAKDSLKIKGATDCAEYSPVLRLYIFLKEYEERQKDKTDEDGKLKVKLHRRKVTAYETEEVWEAGFNTITELGPFRRLPSPMGAKKKPYPWLLLAFKLLQEEWGTAVAQRAKDQFYNGENDKDYMVALRNYIVASPSSGIVEESLGIAFYCFNRYLKHKTAGKVPVLKGKSEKLDKNPNK